MPAPVVLLHGFATSSARTWGETGWIDLLRDAGRDVHAVDLLGHGTAAKPHDPAAYDALEAAALAAMPDGPVDAVGFSLGARVLLTLAGEHPDRFDRLVLTGVGANLFRADDPELIAGALEGRSDAANPVARYFRNLADAPDADPEALVAYLRRPTHRPLTDEHLARITCPVLVVIGEHDVAGPADPLVARLPDARAVVLPGVDHFGTPKSFACIDAALGFLGVEP